MICNRCGEFNPDDALTCSSCGHKLQSGLSAPSEQSQTQQGEGIAPLSGLDPAVKRGMSRYVEAWIVALTLWAGCWVLLAQDMAWGLYPLAALALAYVRLRGLGREN